jgi:HK97 gp10 family phage protein
MMTMLEFEGIDELIREIDKMEGVTDKLKNKALLAGGDVLLENMKKEVYRNGLNRISGDALESLIRTDPKNKELFVGTAGGNKVPGYYLYMHEFGFYNVWAQRFIPPRPFASIAFESSKPQILESYVEIFRKGLGMT